MTGILLELLIYLKINLRLIVDLQVPRSEVSEVHIYYIYLNQRNCSIYRSFHLTENPSDVFPYLLQNLDLRLGHTDFGM